MPNPFLLPSQPPDIVVPSVTGGAGTLLQLGQWNTLNDTFVAHPACPTGHIYNLNDFTNWTLEDTTGLGGGLSLGNPEPELYLVGNPRSTGKRLTRRNYGSERRITAHLILGQATTYSQFISNFHNLTQLLEGISPSQPAALLIQVMGSSQPVYADVLEGHFARDLHYEELLWAQLIDDGITVVFTCRPFLRGPRQYLSNLTVNPGFEAPSGPPIQVFSDPFTNVNSYTVVSGTAPSVASNVMTIPAGTTLTFGSPNWNAINLWQVRFQLTNAGMNAYFFIHRKDASNDLHAFVSGSSLAMGQTDAGTTHTIATTGIALTVGNWYWLQITQFPAVPGVTPYVSATLFNDSSGAIGSQIATIAGLTYDAVTALSGVSGFYAGNSQTMALGGNYTNVHATYLFGPGGWPQIQNYGTGLAAGAWDTAVGNVTGVAPSTYPGGPVTSFGAARLDAAPAGTFSAFWYNYIGGAPAGTWAIPVSAAGNVFGVSCYAKSSGLGTNATVTLGIGEWDASGNFLRQAAVQTVSGPTTNSGWTHLSGTYTTGASCAYLQVQLGAGDTSAPGASANATVWFDNVQVWNQSTTGQTTMPYCELRFPQSPAQFMVSGLMGEVSAPCALALGTFFPASSSTAVPTVEFILGRRQTPTSSGQIVGHLQWSGSATSQLNTAAYGGWALSSGTAVTTWPLVPDVFNVGQFNNTIAGAVNANELGSYEFYQRLLSQEGSANLKNVAAQTTIFEQDAAINGAAVLGAVLAPLVTSSILNTVDLGKITIPPAAVPTLRDETKVYSFIRASWTDKTVGGAVMQADWWALVPLDGGAVIGSLTMPSSAQSLTTGLNSPFWWWTYWDGLAALRGTSAGGIPTVNMGAGTSGSSGISDPTSAVAASGSQTSANWIFNATTTPYLVLDPTTYLNGLTVNQFAGFVTENSGAWGALAVYADIIYSPLYLFPE